MRVKYRVFMGLYQLWHSIVFPLHEIIYIIDEIQIKDLLSCDYLETKI